MRSYLRREESTTRLSLGLAVLSLLMLFLMTVLMHLNLTMTLAVAIVALAVAILSGCLATYGVLRTRSWPFRLVNVVAIVAALFAILAWGDLLVVLGSGCLAVTC